MAPQAVDVKTVFCLAFLYNFGDNKASNSTVVPCDLLTGMGYVTMRFDMRRCGESEGAAASRAMRSSARIW